MYSAVHAVVNVNDTDCAMMPIVIDTSTRTSLPVDDHELLVARRTPYLRYRYWRDVAGSTRVTFDLEARERFSIDTWIEANRLHVFAIDATQEGASIVRQFSWPLEAEPWKLTGVEAASLVDFVRFAIQSAQVQRQFTQYAPVSAAYDGNRPPLWSQPSHLAGLEPITAALLVYERLRRGEVEAVRRGLPRLREMIKLPDLGWIARRLDAEAPAPHEPPLFLDGALIARLAGELPQVDLRFDYRGPWTSWFGESRYSTNGTNEPEPSPQKPEPIVSSPSVVSR